MLVRFLFCLLILFAFLLGLTLVLVLFAAFVSQDVHPFLLSGVFFLHGTGSLAALVQRGFDIADDSIGSYFI